LDSEVTRDRAEVAGVEDGMRLVAWIRARRLRAEPPGSAASEGSAYTRDDLRTLRLEGLPLLLGVQYLLALPWMLIGPELARGEATNPGWFGLALCLLAPPVWLLRRASPSAAGTVLIAGQLAVWTAALRLFPSPLVALLAPLIVGAGSALFGSRGALAVAGLAAAVLAASASVLGPNLALAAVLASGAAAGLFHLAARPAVLALEWAWSSYADAREKRAQLEARQAELSATLRSLDLTHRRLEHLNDELNRARRAADDARRLKSEFAASISHELRTPLNLIVGFSEMMVRTPHAYGLGELPPAYRADVDAIHRNARHLASLIDDVLDLSQIEAGRMGMVRTPAHLAGVVDEATKAVGARFASLGLWLRSGVPDDLPRAVMDRTRVRQILINLLNNAARFTDRGGVRVEAERRGNEVVVSVADTGVGIPPEELPRVFEEFHQGGGAIERRVGGTGLGLSISKRLVELHGGAMWVESRVGHGSTFFFSLPLADQVVAGTLPGDWAVWDRVERARGRAEPTLAVLAESDTIRRVLDRQLDGYGVVAVEDPTGIARLRGEVDLAGVVVASASPDEALRDLARVEPFVDAAPVGFCVAGAWADRARLLGVAAYLNKPVLPDQLERALSRLGPRVRRILVVDDNPDMVRFLARTIRGLGRRYRAWQATGGREALALMRERPPDALLLDLLMPEVDGYAVLEAMRADDALRRVPVVAVSARGAALDRPASGLVGVTRSGGLTTDEMVRCLRSCFDALSRERAAPAAPARPGVLAG
jgi:signal transduction histidine kinase/CheY-like chemotaxis protein